MRTTRTRGPSAKVSTMPGATAGVRLVDDAAIDATARLLDVTRGQAAGS